MHVESLHLQSLTILTHRHDARTRKMLLLLASIAEAASLHDPSVEFSD